MVCAVSTYCSCRDKVFRNYLLLFIFKMPFYAVANGRIPGVYKTWEECQIQTKGFPQAKYRKFNTENEAADFVKKSGFSSSSLSFNGSTSSSSNILENTNPPDLKALGKYSSQTLLKQDKLSMIAEKLDDFIEKTNKKLSEFTQRLDRLEMLYSNESSEGKRKPDESNESEESHEHKKKRTLNKEIPSLNIDGLELKKDISNKSKSGDEGKEEVDYPWGSNYRPSHDGFIVDNDGYIVVYTDGACSNNGKRGAKAGIGVWFNHNHPFNVAAPVVGTATNNNAEIQAAIRAIDQANLAGIRRLNINTDSQFMINCMTDWIKKWKKNNWVTSAGGPVKNKEQLVILDRSIQKLEAVKWTHVRGHMGNEGNECADALAVQGATMY